MNRTPTLADSSIAPSRPTRTRPSLASTATERTPADPSLRPFEPPRDLSVSRGVPTRRSRAMLWVDKYRPHTLDKFQHANADIATHLKRLVADGDCPHLLFYGVSGAGKKTLALAVLREIFGPSVEKVKVEGKTWKLEQGDRKIEVELTTLSSNYHVEMNPSDVGTKDRYVVQEVIKDMARSRPIDAAGERGFKVLLLNEVDRLSKEAQHGLRRTMEKYSQACRLILICNSVSKVLDAVRSRCLPIRVAAPSDAQVEALLNDVARREKLTLPPELAASRSTPNATCVARCSRWRRRGCNSTRSKPINRWRGRTGRRTWRRLRANSSRTIAQASPADSRSAVRAAGELHPAGGAASPAGAGAQPQAGRGTQARDGEVGGALRTQAAGGTETHHPSRGLRRAVHGDVQKVPHLILRVRRHAGWEGVKCE